ncbi:MAG TPA: LysE family transporter [Ginsengibacter sp.]
MGFAKVFFWGMVISFLGTLPLSTLNVAAMQISSQEGIAKAMYFSLGTLFTEMIYVRISLVGIKRILRQKKLFRWMEWITFILILVFAAGSFYAANQQRHSENVLLNNTLNRFLLGMFMSSITFMHFPFWFGWSSILFAKKILHPNRSHYNIYIPAIGTGTFLANCIFIYGGVFMSQKLNKNEHLVNLVLGYIFILTAIIQLVKILWNKNPVKENGIVFENAS